MTESPEVPDERSTVNHPPAMPFLSESQSETEDSQTLARACRPLRQHQSQDNGQPTSHHHGRLAHGESGVLQASFVASVIDTKLRSQRPPRHSAKESLSKGEEKRVLIEHVSQRKIASVVMPVKPLFLFPGEPFLASKKHSSPLRFSCFFNPNMTPQAFASIRQKMAIHVPDRRNLLPNLAF